MVDFACGRQRFDLTEAVDRSSTLFGSVVDGKPRSINELIECVFFPPVPATVIRRKKDNPGITLGCLDARIHVHKIGDSVRSCRQCRIKKLAFIGTTQSSTDLPACTSVAADEDNNIAFGIPSMNDRRVQFVGIQWIGCRYTFPKRVWRLLSRYQHVLTHDDFALCIRNCSKLQDRPT